MSQGKENLRRITEVAIELTRRFTGLPYPQRHRTDPVGQVGQEMAKRPDAFSYVPTHPAAFAEALLATGGMTTKGKFLDIGCGIGDKPFLAAMLGQFSHADGLEFNSGLCAIANYLRTTVVGLGRYRSLTSDSRRPYEQVHYIHGDATEFDRYGEYRYLYTFNISKDPCVLGQIYHRVLTQMCPSAKFVLYYYPHIMIRRQRTNFEITSLRGGKPILTGKLDSVLEWLASRGLSPYKG